MVLWRKSPKCLSWTFGLDGHQRIRCAVSATTLSFHLCSWKLAGRPLDYRVEIDSFVAKIKELRAYELSKEEWCAIELITKWLRAFCDATTEKSATKRATLSSMHGVLKGLQDHLVEQITNLPTKTSPEIHEALLASHRKLSDYFWKIDQSPHVIWASCEPNSSLMTSNLLICIISLGSPNQLSGAGRWSQRWAWALQAD